MALEALTDGGGWSSSQEAVCLHPPKDLGSRHSWGQPGVVIGSQCFKPAQSDLTFPPS